jgi:hypothetical protein
MAIIQCGNTSLPAPSTISVDDEIIWSENTGRTTSGKMLGDVVAEKKSISIAWGVLTASQLSTIKSSLIAGFFSIQINIGETINITSYRGTLTSDYLGKMTDNIHYYKSATVKIIQQ